MSFEKATYLSLINTIETKHSYYLDSKGLVGEQTTFGAVSDFSIEFPKYAKELESLRID